MSTNAKKGAAGLASDGASLNHEIRDLTPARAVNEVDSGAIGWDGADHHRHAVPTVDGIRATEFDAEPDELMAHMTPRERCTYELRVAAVRYLAGIEPRSFQEIADDLGVTRAAVSRVYRDVLARVGCRKIFDDAIHRWRIAEATKQTAAERRAA